ncbi:Tgds, partial [Symbiodinium microadriaticum]
MESPPAPPGAEAMQMPEASGDYAPRRVLFTGGAGFIGSNVLIYFVQKYPEVFFLCLDNLSEGANLLNLDPIRGARNFLFVEGDILCSKAVRRVLADHQLDTVMHFAAQTHVDRSFVVPMKFTEVNAMGTAVLLQAARECRIRRFLHVSTDEVYGENVHGHIFSETDGFRPMNPYSASKAAAECIVHGYVESFGRDLPIV